MQLSILSCDRDKYSPWCVGCWFITGWCISGWCNIWTPTFPLSGALVGFFWNDGTNSGASADNNESKGIIVKWYRIMQWNMDWKKAAVNKYEEMKCI